MGDQRVLLLGLGFWGSNWMKTLSKPGDWSIAGVSGCREDLERISAEYGIPSDAAYTDYREAIDQVDADIVVIAIPTPFHVEAAKRALAKSMHVLSEKPLASSMDEVRDVIEFRKSYPGQKYMVDQNYRWRPHTQTLRRAIGDGLVGKVGAVHLEFRRPEDLLGYREFLDMPLLQDVSIHHFDLVRFLTGANCRRIFAQCYRPEWSAFPGKSATEAVLTMDNGVVVNYTGTWAARGKLTSWDGSISVTGDKGCLVLDEQDAVWFHGTGEQKPKRLEKVKMERTELDYALSLLLECIRTGGDPETAVEDNRHSFAMVCAAQQSVETGIPVDL